MLKSLKKIVIVLGILIISLTIIVIITLFNRINNVSILKKEDNYVENIKIGDKFVIEDFSVDDGKIYFYLSDDASNSKSSESRMVPFPSPGSVSIKYSASTNFLSARSCAPFGKTAPVLPPCILPPLEFTV